MSINWEVVKPSLWSGVGGVVVGMFLLSYGFGFMGRKTAEELASTSSEKAVNRQLDENLLRRTAGPYIWVKTSDFDSSSGRPQ